MDLVPWLLFAHVLGAVIAFGPGFAAPLMGGMGAKEPMHANFGLRIGYAIAKRITWPLALLQGVTGLGLLLVLQIDLTKSVWLGVAIVLYLVALGYSYVVQMPTVAKVVEMTSAPPPAGAAGPPPQLLALIGRIKRGGMFLTVLVVAIVFLMVVKPGA